MDFEHTLQESELYSVLPLFELPLESSKHYFEKSLKTKFTSSKPLLKERQENIEALRKNPSFLESASTKLKLLKEAETKLLSYTPNETSKVSEGQIFFQGESTKGFNLIPYCIAIFVFLKIWVAPLLGLMMPLVLAVMPYVIMTQVMDMQITWDMYQVLMKQMVLGLQSGESWKPKHYGQALWTLGSLAQGIIQPFITAYHTRALDKEIQSRGVACIQIYTTLQTILNQANKFCPVFKSIQLPEPPSEPHEAVAWMQQEPLAYKQLLHSLGYVSTWIQIARDMSWKPVNFTASNTFQIQNMHDLCISQEKAIESTIYLKGHSLLTGPNRGGKSSSLRSIVQQVILGQTFGFTFSAEGSWHPFQLIFTRLKSRDTAGKESLFEMEVRHASRMLKMLQIRNSHSLVLVDELFHSTNPPDAEIAAKLFLNKLWAHKHVKSMISTHIFSLCDIKHQTPLQLFACPAKEQTDGSIDYSYRLVEGQICTTSSVREVLKESGIL
jgi:hypothetical protein